MALQAGKLPLIGKVGDLVFYLRKGKACARRRPLTIKQTENTKQAASRFGIASRTGKMIRDAFAPHLVRRHDGEWVNRLNKKLIAEGVQGIKGYRFNLKTDISLFLRGYILGEDHILRIPHFIKPRDKKITHMEIRVIAVRMDLSSGRVINSVCHSYMHDLKQPFEGIEFDTTVPGEGSLLVALQVHPYQGKYPLHDKKFMATDLIAIDVAPAQTVSKKLRKHQTNRLQPAIHQQGLSKKELPADITTDNLSSNISRLGKQKE